MDASRVEETLASLLRAQREDSERLLALDRVLLSIVEILVEDLAEEAGRIEAVAKTLGVMDADLRFRRDRASSLADRLRGAIRPASR